jgi:uncharacterized protein (TIGR02596 family)
MIMTSPSRTLPAARPHAFTLIEILLVVTIMGVMLTAAGGLSSDIADSMSFREAIQQVKGQMESARQTAITTNRSVSVRIIQGEDEFGEVVWNGVQLGFTECISDPDAAGYATPVAGSYEPGFKAMDTIDRLPAGFVFHDNTTFSTLLSQPEGLGSGMMTDASGKQREYVSFAFLPEGRCTLPSEEKWTLTMVRQRHLSADTLPIDYAAIQIDARTARCRIYRR